LAVVCTARQTPVPVEYPLRKAGLGQEESTPSSGRYDFMSQLTQKVSHDRSAVNDVQLQQAADRRARYWLDRLVRRASELNPIDVSA
jgi:hypothetical protein